MLESRDVRAAARLTGSAACPYRCEVKPVVPEVDQTLASQLESHFEDEYMERASSTSLADEERRSTEVNEWVARGCELDLVAEVAIQAEEATRAQTVLTHLTQERAKERLWEAIIVVSVFCTVLLFTLLGVVLMTAFHPRNCLTAGPALFALSGLSAAFVLLDVLLAWRMMQPGALAVTPARIATPPAEGDALPAPRHFLSIHLEHAPPGMSEIELAPLGLAMPTG